MWNQMSQNVVSCLSHSNTYMYSWSLILSCAADSFISLLKKPIGVVHPNTKMLSFTHPHVVQTCMTFLLWNTKEMLIKVSKLLLLFFFSFNEIGLKLKSHTGLSKCWGKLFCIKNFGCTIPKVLQKNQVELF